MKTLGRFEFPETRDEALDWKEYETYVALHSKVLAYAHTRIEGTWSAYIFPVPGYHHREEKLLWRTDGDRLSEALARLLFPLFDGVPYHT